MSTITAKVDEGTVRIGLGELRAAVTDVRPLLNIAGEVMRGSVARTFRDEGSPAGSWPALALSTLKKKGYTSGHKLLVLSGRLFGSISYDTMEGNTLTIGTNLVYAPVQQFGSADYRGNFTGPLSHEQHLAHEAERVDVGAHRSSRGAKQRYGTTLVTAKNGRVMKVRVKIAGPLNRSHFGVGEHKRHQNIPPRPFLVFRPEDPARMVEGFEAYLMAKAKNIGQVRAAGGAQ
jgi:phage gpG-like protein